MCYSEGGDKSRFSTDRCSLGVFDCGSDTYFGTYTEPRERLRHHWNLGWSGNRYLDFRPSDPPASAPGAGTGE